MFWLALTFKLVLTAGIVVAVSIIVERAGPLLGALVMTLPVTLGPAYVFLALEHPPSYIASSAAASLSVNSVTGIFMLVYLHLAQRHGVFLSLFPALSCWIGLASLAQSRDWPVAGALLTNIIVYACCVVLSRRYDTVWVPRAQRPWYELPLRALLVVVFMSGVLALSQWAGPHATGMLAVYPVSTTCTLLVLHVRLGGRVSAAVVANGLWGLIGIAFGLATVAEIALDRGTALALALGLLAIPAAWNMSVWRLRRRARRCAPASS
jgi:hypothetical protein